MKIKKIENSEFDDRFFYKRVASEANLSWTNFDRSVLFPNGELITSTLEVLPGKRDRIIVMKNLSSLLRKFFFASLSGTVLQPSEISHSRCQSF